MKTMNSSHVAINKRSITFQEYSNSTGVVSPEGALKYLLQRFSLSATMHQRTAIVFIKKSVVALYGLNISSKFMLLH